jgi:signal transduction histidine kinase
MEEPSSQTILAAELADLQAQYERLEALFHVSQVIHSTLDSQEAMRRILDEAVRLTRATSGSIVLLNPDGFLEILAAKGLPDRAEELRLRLGEGITGWVARTGKTARVSDVRADARYVMVRAEAVSELAVPLQVNGEVRGVINVDSERQDAFAARDEELLEGLAIQAAGVIHNTWLYDQIRLKASLFESLASVSRTINSTLNLDDALNVITRETCELMRVKVCSVLLLDRSGEWLDVRASCGAGAAYAKKPRVNAEESLVGIVLRRKKPMQIPNVQLSNLYQNVEVAREEGLFAMLSVPLVFAGEGIGVISVYKSEIYNFSNEEIRTLRALGELSAIAIEKARLYERLVDVEEQLRKDEKLSALGLLAAEVAHEIRNPLTVMKMLYHSLDLKFSADDPRARDARVIGEKMELLNKIVERILDFARSTEPAFEPVNLNEIIEELGLLVRHKLKNQSIEFRQDLEMELPEVLGEATQLEQAFLNLMLNSAEAMPAGGLLELKSRAVALQDETFTETVAHPTHVLIEFADSGEGMPLEQQNKAFSSVLSTTKRKGTGLGLAIVGRVVETHRGKIQMVSEKGQGTTIRIFLPVPS